MKSKAYGTLILIAPVLLCALCASAVNSPAADPDSDGDGLSDFQEIHKYFTDPRNSDSDGDGVHDGDWNERPEFSYSIRTVLRIMPPITPFPMFVSSAL